LGGRRALVQPTLEQLGEALRALSAMLGTSDEDFQFTE
jgi:hypothetical protein